MANQIILSADKRERCKLIIRGETEILSSTLAQAMQREPALRFVVETALKVLNQVENEMSKEY